MMDAKDRVRAAAEVLEQALGAEQVRRDGAINTTMRAGGGAPLVVEARSTAEAATALAVLRAHGVAVAALGLGSNTIVPDEGFVGGAVLWLGGALKQPIPQVEDIGEDQALVTFGAGVPNAQAIKALHKQGWTGAECIALVPGTQGGAVAMNAGTKHGEIVSVLDAIEVANPDGSVCWLSKDALSMSYRTAHLPPGSAIGRVRLRVHRGDIDAGRAQIQAEKQYRAATQPFKLATSGSIFRNPPGDYAGRLIEACGLKGHILGGAVISPLHANWIVNTASAPASDIIRLIDLARTSVWTRFGIALHPEVRLLSATKTWSDMLTPLA